MPTQKILFTSSQVWSWQPCSPCPQPASLELSVPPQTSLRPVLSPTPPLPTFHWFLPSCLGGRPKPCRKPLPAAHPNSQPALFLQGFWRPQGHTALSGNYSSGQLSLTFLSSELCIFLPLFGGDLVAGQPSSASVQGEAQPNGLAPFTGAHSPSCPSSLRGPPGTPGMDAELPGKRVRALFFLSVPKRRILSQMFLSLGHIFALALRRLPFLTSPLSWEFPP